MKNRTIIGVVCIILSVTVMFGISPILNKMASKKIEVVQLSKKVEQGEKITADDIVKVTIGSFGVNESVIKDEKQIIGKYAGSDIIPNVNIYPEMLTETLDNAEDTFKALDGTQRAMSISISKFANGLSGKLENGDIISVVSVADNKSVIPAELTYVKVITVTTSKGKDSDELTPNEDGTTDLPATVTLLVNPTQAKLLALYEQNASLHLALVYRGNSENADKFLETQNKVFEKVGVTNE